MSEHVRERLSPFLDGELPPPERAAIEGHLESCAECAAVLEDLATLDALARDLPAPVPAEGFDAFPARVRARISARPRRRGALPVWGWAVAAALLLAVVTPLTLRERPSQAPASAPERNASLRIEPPPPAAAPLPAASAPPATVMAQDAAKELQVEVDSRAYRAREARQKADETKVLATRRDDALALEDGASATGVAGGVVGGAPGESAAPAAPSGAEQAEQQRRQAPAPGRHGPYAQATRAPESVTVAQAQAPDKKREASSGDKEGFSAPAAATPAPPGEDADRATGKVGEFEKGATAQERAGALRTAPRDEASAKPKAAPAERALNGRLEEAVDLSLAKAPFESVAAAREAREAWRAYVRDRPLSPRADEARVRTIEAGLAAWELSREEQDRTVLQRDIAEYLQRRDAAQAPHVRALRQRIERR